MSGATFYNDDLAYIHDVGHGDFARCAAPELLLLLRQYDVHSGRIVELGCGSGIMAAECVRAGFEVVGVDLSADLLAIARNRVPQAQFICDSLFRVELPACSAVLSMGECCNYAFDECSGEEGLRRVFSRVYAALRPGGVFIFDVIEPGRERGMPPKRWRQGHDWAVLVEAEEQSERQSLVRRITSFRKTGSLYRKDEETHTLWLYRSADVAAWLRATGFRVRVMRGYGSLRFTQSHAAFVARKHR